MDSHNAKGLKVMLDYDKVHLTCQSIICIVPIHSLYDADYYSTVISLALPKA